MTSRTALGVIFGIAMFGLLFSGYLSYGELTRTCTAGCPLVAPAGTVFGYPACVYGFFMYLVIVVLAGMGLRAKR